MSRVIEYRANVVSLILRAIIAAFFLGLGVLFLIMLFLKGGQESDPWVMAFPPIFLFLGYAASASLFWPIGLTFNTGDDHVTVRYLFKKGTLRLADIKRCRSGEVPDGAYRYRSRRTYLLELKDRRIMVLSEMNIARFPSRFAEEIGVDVTEGLPCYILGFAFLLPKDR